MDIFGCQQKASKENKDGKKDQNEDGKDDENEDH
jgi:hypothetical protein